MMTKSLLYLALPSLIWPVCCREHVSSHRWSKSKPKSF